MVISVTEIIQSYNVAKLSPVHAQLMNVSFLVSIVLLCFEYNLVIIEWYSFFFFQINTLKKLLIHFDRITLLVRAKTLGGTNLKALRLAMVGLSIMVLVLYTLLLFLQGFNIGGGIAGLANLAWSILYMVVLVVIGTVYVIKLYRWVHENNASEAFAKVQKKNRILISLLVVLFLSLVSMTFDIIYGYFPITHYGTSFRFYLD